MLKETITFTDFNDNPATEVIYFNLTKNELIDLEASVDGGLSAMMRSVEDNPTAKNVLELLKTLTHASYGLKSPDGKYFDKSPEITNRFIHSAFYDDFLFSLIENDAQKGLAFIRGIVPAPLLAEAEKQIQARQNSEVDRTAYAPSARETFAAAQEQKITQSAPDNSGFFGQPSYPQFNQQDTAIQAITPPAETAALRKTLDNATPEELERFRAWMAAKDAEQATSNPASAPASPDAFRVREEDPAAGQLPRPPHEQFG